MSIKVSIIIPVFNTEKYLNRCIDSCLNQTLDDIEIILIDDCSSDKSRDIILDYVKKNPDKIKYIFQKEKHRQGVARNIGMDIALGEYYLFIDSDDWIEPDMCEEMYNLAKAENADMVGSDYFLSWDNRDEKVYLKWNNSDAGEMTTDKKEKIVKKIGLFAMRLYNADFLKRYKLVFPENTYYEDAFFNFYSILFCNKILKINKAYYHYYQGNQSTVRNINNPHQYERITLAEYLYNYGKNNKELNPYMDIINYKYLYMQGANLIYTCLSMFDKPDKEKMIKIDKGIREKNLYKNKVFKDLSDEFRFYLKLNRLSAGCCVFGFKHSIYAKLEILLNKLGWKKMNIITLAKSLRHKAYIKYYSSIPIKKNKIIMWANSFKQYGCSPKYITEYLLENYPDKYDIVWVFEPQVKIPEGLCKRVRIVYYFSIEYLKELHTAKFVICNMRTSDAYFWHKRKGQIYIQTWHSSIRLKKIEKDAEQCIDEGYINSGKEDSKKIDILLSGCDFSTKIFENSFWYSGKIMKSGTPRCDVLIGDTSKIKNKVFEYYNIDKNAKIVIYAPTFRKGNDADLHGVSPQKIITALESRFGGEWVFMYRLHPNIIVDYNFKMTNSIDATKYPDMQELIASSDFMITDYSSCMFDMLIAGKKCALYAPDVDEYIKDERGLYFEFDELPFPLARTNEELSEIINKFNEENYMKSRNIFMEKIGSYETGHASECVVMYLNQKMYE